MAVRFLPHTVQLHVCFCCSFIFLRTASFSTLTRDLRSVSLSPNQNSLIRSRSSCEFVFHIFSLDIPGRSCCGGGGGGTGAGEWPWSSNAYWWLSSGNSSPGPAVFFFFFFLGFFDFPDAACAAPFRYSKGS